MPVHYEITDRVATITLDHPEVKNALNQDGLDALAAHLEDAADNDRVWLVSIRAVGGDFCTGQDVKELAGKSAPGGDFFAPIFRGLKAIYKPVVCAARGLALAGGAGIVMGSDVRIVSETTRMGWPHTKIGICSIGGPSSLARAVPVNVALELMFTGDFLPAERALALNLVNQVVPDAELEAAADRMIEKIMRNAPLALRAAKQSTLSTVDLPYDDAVAKAQGILNKLLESRDSKEGMQAFVEKRAPKWEGR
ncbi:MAG: enoyl-CoA hydratase/isomerase family protein [Rickettsiales bacterium]|jgi:enoyl-CoA hydratase/carnithine racemase